MKKNVKKKHEKVKNWLFESKKKNEIINIDPYFTK